MGNAIFYKNSRYPTGGSGGGGGGSSVIPNPSGTPTDTLDTIEIDGDIYEIQGGSGGSSTICSTNPPTTSEGSNGDLYFYYKVSQGIFDYLKFEVTQTRTRDGYVQFRRIGFCKKGC